MNLLDYATRSGELSAFVKVAKELIKNAEFKDLGDQLQRNAWLEQVEELKYLGE